MNVNVIRLFIFGYQHIMVDGVRTHNTGNANGPSAVMYAWMGPFIGALIRPVGGIIADKIGGAKVTQIISFVMLFSALGVAYYDVSSEILYSGLYKDFKGVNSCSIFFKKITRNRSESET